MSDHTGADTADSHYRQRAATGGPAVDPAHEPDRIALCSVGELFGGVERHILGLLDGLRSRGIEARLVLFHDGELARRAREQGVEPLVLPGSNLATVAAARQLARELARRSIQVVHVHGYKAAVVCSLARRRQPFALVKTEHGLAEPMTGRPLPALKERLYRLLDVAATRAGGATVCYVSDELRHHYRTLHRRLPVRTIVNGIPPIDRARLPRPPELPVGPFNLIAVGRLDSVKGLQFAIRALALADDPAIRLWLVGCGPCQPELEALARSLGVAGRCHFLGFRREVFGWIAHSDAFLIPSLHEGLPYVLLEAMALETPIVASRVGGLAEVLTDGDDALLVTPGDVTALARAVVRLKADPRLGRRLAGRALALQRQRFSLQAMTTAYLAAYRAALAGGS